MGYYDIEDILADGTDVPCRFKHDIPGLGYLENNPGRPIVRNTKLVLPLWLARILAIVGEEPKNLEGAVMIGEEPVPFVELLTPDCFSSKAINAMRADAASLDLHAINAHYYALAAKWASLFEDSQLASTAFDLLLKRALVINNHAAGAAAGPNLNSTFLQTMETFEQELYRVVQRTYKDTQKWMVG